MASIVQNTAFQRPQTPSKDLPTATSSFIQDFKYDAQSLQLVVTMKSGSEYVYSMVSPDVYEGLIKAPSKGKFFSEAIKGRFVSQQTVNKNIGSKKGQIHGAGHR